MQIGHQQGALFWQPNRTVRAENRCDVTDSKLKFPSDARH
jgi:hypothetical protein